MMSEVWRLGLPRSVQYEGGPIPILESLATTDSLSALACLAATSFWAMPPIGPTLPSSSISPVPAMTIPPVRSVGSSLSTMPRANMSPADGPPIRSRSIFRSNGCGCFCSTVIPIRGLPSSAFAGARVRVVAWPPRVMPKVRAVPAGLARISSVSFWADVTWVPSTVAITSPGSSWPSAGAPLTTSLTVTCTGYLRPPCIFSCEAPISKSEQTGSPWIVDGTGRPAQAAAP